jgi:hypothetical protein
MWQFEHGGNVSTPQPILQLQTRKDDIGTTRLHVHELELGDGDIVLELSSFALTANNMTYAAFGDAMRYWQFFPTGEEAWGHMPVWGFADVVMSNVAGISPGERFYGYFPIASHIRMTPVHVSSQGFFDGAKHRLPLVAVYNQYARCSADPIWSVAEEDYQSLFRPLFFTSFMLADFLSDNGFFGARQIVFSSASSKTAYGTAFCLKGDPGIETIALTSPQNLEFVTDLDCYNTISCYADLEKMPKERPTIYVDFSGGEELRARIHNHFGFSLMYDCFAGSAQNVGFLRDTGLPGPQASPYFAPVQIRKRNADWGPGEVIRRINEAQRLFFDYLNEPYSRRLEISRRGGFEAAREVITNLATGRVDPRKGHIIVLGLEESGRA